MGLHTWWLTDEGAGVVKDLMLAYVIEGKLFIATSGMLGCAAGTEIVGIIRMADGYHLHGSIQVRGSSDFIMRILEAPTVISSGTQNDFFNYNREMTGVLHTTLYAAMIVSSSALSATGTTIMNKYIPSGEGKFGGGGSHANAGSEWMFAEDTTYCLLITPQQSGTFAMSMDMYEHSSSDH